MTMTDWTGTDPHRATDDRGLNVARLYAGTAGLPSRALALGIDYVVLLAAYGLIYGLAHVAGLDGQVRETVTALLAFAIITLYFAVLESSTSQGTLGKIVLGLQVTDDEGRPITFARALGRFFAKLLSLVPFGVGFLMAAFSDRNRALHDVLANTLVYRVR